MDEFLGGTTANARGDLDESSRSTRETKAATSKANGTIREKHANVANESKIGRIGTVRGLFDFFVSANCAEIRGSRQSAGETVYLRPSKMALFVVFARH